MLFKVTWTSKRFGTSQVEASSLEEARQLVEQGEDKYFEMDDYLDDWEIESVEPLEV